MKKQFQNLLKGIFLGSISSLISSNSANALIYDVTKLKLKDDGQTTETNAKKDNSQKFILKFKSDNSYLIAGHRSHSSHASHASHASHRSSSTYSGTSSVNSSSDYLSPATPATPSNSTISRTPSNSDLRKSNQNGSNTASSPVESINLGDRLLKKGMIGVDVSQLKKILIEKKLLPTTLNDEVVLFDEKIEMAIIAFQKSHGILADGIVGSKTIYYLKK